MQRRILVAALTAVAANTLANEQPLEHVLVSVPLHKTEAETALPVTVLSGDELKRLATTSIGDTLRDQPGIANASFGPGVGRPVLRGQAGPRTVTLQNGTASADVSSLSPDHAVGVEPFLAESVEVLRGPATLLYGGGAIGGVVNVIDNRIPRSVPDTLSGGAEYRHDTATGLDSLTGVLEGAQVISPSISVQILSNPTTSRFPVTRCASPRRKKTSTREKVLSVVRSPIPIRRQAARPSV